MTNTAPDVAGTSEDRTAPGQPSDPPRRVPETAWHGGLWLQWVVYTALAYTLLGVVTTGVLTRGSGGLALMPVVVALGLALVGLLQWMVLRPLLRALRPVRWILATILGQGLGSLAVSIVVLGPLALGWMGGLAALIGATPFQLVSKLVGGAVLGGTIGLLQWLVLRRLVPGAAWWILASAVAYALTTMVPPLVMRGAGLDVPAAQIADRLIFGLIVGTITGAAWLRLLSPSARRAAADA